MTGKTTAFALLLASLKN